MHELGVVFHIIRQLERVAEENSVTRITAVILELGEVSTVIPSYLTDCWRWAVKKTELLQNAELRIEPIPAVTHCDGCGRDYPTVQYGKICPHCGSEATWLRQGSEFLIREIECE